MNLKYPICFSYNSNNYRIVSSSGVHENALYGIWFDFSTMKPSRHGPAKIVETDAWRPGMDVEEVLGPIDAPAHVTFMNGLGFAARVSFDKVLPDPLNEHDTPR